MDKINFKKVNILPNKPEKNTLYFVENGDYAEVYLTSSKGVYKKVGNSAIIKEFFSGNIPVTGYNKTNWDTAYSWGNHSLVGYLTSFSETDPIFTAWDRSTGISILAEQVSDFDTKVSSNSNVLVNTNKISFPGFTSLLVDYGFTDNSVNWNTAFGWGDWSTGVNKSFVDTLNVNAGTLDGIDSTGFSLVGHSHAFAEITAKPTTILGYGITDAYTKTQSDSKYLLNTTDEFVGTLTVLGDLNITNWKTVESGGNLYVYNTNTNNKHIIYGVETNGTKHFNSYVGYGTDAPGQKLHVADGNILLEGGGETANIYKRGVTFTNLHINSPFVNPTFQIGRIIQGGDGAPQFRWIYSDDNTPETVVMELDSEGIMSSVRDERGSHFEGHIQGEFNPFFRINSFPDIRLEFGEGGMSGTDVSMSRPSANQIAFNRGTGVSETESVRIDENGWIGIGTNDPQSNIHAIGDIRASNTLFSSGIRIGWDTIEQVGADIDGASIAINYNGFNGGTTRFRNLGVFDGKNGIIWDVVGATKRTEFYGDIGTQQNFEAVGTISAFGGNSTQWNEAVSWGNHSLSGYEFQSNKDIPNGYAGLDSNGKLLTSVLPYKTYVAKISQAGTSAPTATVLENNLGATITFARTGAGVYTATASATVLTTNKTTVFIQSNINNINGAPTVVNTNVESTTVINIITSDVDTVGATYNDECLEGAFLEIKVYP